MKLHEVLIKNGEFGPEITTELNKEELDTTGQFSEILDYLLDIGVDAEELIEYIRKTDEINK